MVKQISTSHASMTIVERVDGEGNAYQVESPNSHPELRAGDLHVVDDDTGEVSAFFAKGAFASFRHHKAQDAA